MAYVKFKNNVTVSFCFCLHFGTIQFSMSHCNINNTIQCTQVMQCSLSDIYNYFVFCQQTFRNRQLYSRFQCFGW